MTFNSRSWALVAVVSAVALTAIARFARSDGAIAAIPLLLLISFIAAVLWARRGLRSRTQMAIEVFVRHPRKVLTVTVGFIFAYGCALALASGNGVDAARLTLEVLFAITSPNTAVPYESGAANHVLGAILPWAGWIAVASWALTVPALAAIVIEDAASTVEVGNYLRLSVPAETYLKRYSTALADQARALLAFYQTPGPERQERVDEFIRQTLSNTSLIAQSFVGRDHRASMNASFSRMRLGADYPLRNAQVLYDKRLAGEVEYVLEVTYWAKPVPGIDAIQPILLAVDLRHPVPGGPAAIVKNAPQVVSDARDPECWRDLEMPGDQIQEAVDYFRKVPFRSFISIPVTYASTPDEPHAVLTIQSDTSHAFEVGTDDADMLLKQLQPFLVLLGSVEEA